MSDIYFKKNRGSKLQGKHRWMRLMIPANSKGNMRSSAVTPGNETKMKDRSVFQVLSSHRILQGTWILSVNATVVGSGPPSPALTDSHPCTQHNLLTAVKCCNGLTKKKYDICLLKKILANKKELLAHYNLDIEHQAPCAFTLKWRASPEGELKTHKQ